jgi:hypothetical protein
MQSVSKTLVNFHPTALDHIPGDSTLHSHCCQILKPNKFTGSFVFFAEIKGNESIIEKSCKFICTPHLIDYFAELEEI